MTYAFITAAEAAATIHHGDTVGIGGFSSVGTPKAVPEALAAYAEAQHAQGKEFKVGLITGGATGCQVDSALVKAHAVSFRTPFQSNKDMRESINQHEVQYFDLHLSQIGQDVRYGFLGKIHVAIVEASDLTDDGEVILSTSVGISPTLLQVAERVIIELNEAHTGKLTGMHDINIPANPPYRTEIPVYHVNDRAGHISVKIDPKKITGVVRTNARDHIAAAGYGDYFTHRLGHFIGMEDHEQGDVSAANAAPAQAGMVFSIEPGVYLPGEFGVRIEDLVIVTEDGCESLNHVDKQWKILGI